MSKRVHETHTCFACGGCIEDEEPVLTTNQRTGNTWHSHSRDECRLQPVPDSHAATARLMAMFGDDDVDWDAWKDEMKEREP